VVVAVSVVEPLNTNTAQKIDKMPEAPTNIRGVKGRAMPDLNCSAPFAPYTINLERGFNLISIPVEDYRGMDVATLLPVGTLGAIGHEDFMYYNVYSFETCEGYWIYATTNTSMELCGIPVEECCYNLSRGWTLVGSPHAEVDIPGGLLSTYYWDTSSNAYAPPTNLQPGLGYWMLSSTDRYVCTENITEYDECCEMEFGYYQSLNFSSEDFCYFHPGVDGAEAIYFKTNGQVFEINGIIDGTQNYYYNLENWEIYYFDEMAGCYRHRPTFSGGISLVDSSVFCGGENYKVHYKSLTNYLNVHIKKSYLSTFFVYDWTHETGFDAHYDAIEENYPARNDIDFDIIRFNNEIVQFETGCEERVRGKYSVFNKSVDVEIDNSGREVTSTLYKKKFFFVWDLLNNFRRYDYRN
jgi:hypothetical protein